MSNLKELLKRLDTSKYRLNYPLSNLTSTKIGGPADILYFAESPDDLIKTVKAAKEFNVPITVLGGGTNVLISDKGIRGIVIKNGLTNLEIGKISKSRIKTKTNTSRWNSDKDKGSFKGIEFKDLNYFEDGCDKVDVKIGSGFPLQKAIYDLVDKNITGLQWFAGIPGTIGGAIFNNIHGGTRFFSEFIKNVTVLTPKGEIKKIYSSDLSLDYDKSRFQKSGEIILSAELLLFKGDTKRAKYTADEWKKRKKIQPRNSPGCVFKNITEQQKEKLNYPTTSTGYIIEHILKMSGTRIGDAAISNVHSNFIVNEGKATAEDFLKLVKSVQHKAKEQIGVSLIPEIVYLGFDKEELK